MNMKFDDLFTVTVQVHHDEVLSALRREATAAKNAKDWDRAIDCLRKANEREGNDYSDIAARLRLPLFLQQAGRFEDAMVEFDLLVQDAKPSVDREFAHLGPYGRRAVVASHLMRIYDKMRLACQREKHLDEARRYAGLHDRHAALHVKLRPAAKAEREKRNEDYWLKFEREQKGKAA